MFIYTLLGSEGLAKHFRNVFVLAHDIETARCINCFEPVGAYNPETKNLKLSGAKIRRVACTEFQILCETARCRSGHGHRYRYWSGICDGRKAIKCEKVFFNARGLRMSSPCDAIDTKYLFKVTESDLEKVSVIYSPCPYYLSFIIIFFFGSF